MLIIEFNKNAHEYTFYVCTCVQEFVEFALDSTFGVWFKGIIQVARKRAVSVL